MQKTTAYSLLPNTDLVPAAAQKRREKSYPIVTRLGQMISMLWGIRSVWKQKHGENTEPTGGSPSFQKLLPQNSFGGTLRRGCTSSWLIPLHRLVRLVPLYSRTGAGPEVGQTPPPPQHGCRRSPGRPAGPQPPPCVVPAPGRGRGRPGVARRGTAGSGRRGRPRSSGRTCRPAGTGRASPSGRARGRSPTRRGRCTADRDG